MLAKNLISGRMPRQVIQDFLILACFVFTLNHYSDPESLSSITIELSQTQNDTGQIYVRTLEGYAHSNRAPFKINNSNSLSKYSIDLSSLDASPRIRFDLSTKPHTSRLHSISVQGAENYTLLGKELAKAVRGLNQLEITKSNDKYLVLEHTGNDPHFEILLPKEVIEFSLLSKATHFSMLVLFICVITYFLHFSPSFQSKIPLFFSKAFFSPLIVVTVLFFFATLFIANNLHQSSISHWNNYFPESHSEDSILFGRSLGIRSDEWLVQTPWTLSQVNGSFSVEKSNVGVGGAALITPVPIDHISALGQPKFWGFHIFDIEHGFSWLWAYKSFGLFASFFILLSLLTRSTFFSLCGSAWVYGSSFTQWWFSSNLPEILIGFAVSVSSVLIILRQRQRLLSYLAMISLVIFGLTTVLNLYPPFILPLFYLGVAIIAADLYSNREYAFNQPSKLALLLIIPVVVIGSILYITAVDAAVAIDLILNTTYPGKRFSSGGGFEFSRLVSGMFEYRRVLESDFPRSLINASEASNFIVIWPLPIFILLILDKRKTLEPYIVTISIYLLFMFFWMIVGFNEKLAAASGMYLSPPMRSLLGWGVGGIILSTIIASRSNKNTYSSHNPNIQILVILTSFIIVSLVGLWINTIDSFYNQERIIVSSLILALLMSSIVSGQKWLFGLSILALVYHPLQVNPIGQGLAPLMNNPTLIKAKQLNKVESKWLVLGNSIFAQALVSTGIEVVGGNKFVPDPKLYEVLDPENEYVNIWNRYARLTIAEAKDRPTRFEVLGGDHVKLYINPCGKEARELGITNIASTYVLDQNSYECLEEETGNLNPLFFYHIRTNAANVGNTN
tara:strand:- start:2113 stop:4653 length:2541 start_codon:yes stop_codon:yes gene_type:complete